VYDRAKAERPIRFYERLLKLTAGRFLGKPFELAAWQAFAIAQIFGHVDSNGQRLVSEAFIQIAKKNGKSEWAAGLALYLLLADNEPAAEIYGAAASRAQAGLVFNVAAKMVGQSRELHDRLKVYRRSQRIVKRADPWSFYQVISADANTGDGVNPHACIFDEIHRQRHTELYNVLKFGMSARSQGLMLGITTAGAQDASPLARGLYEKARRVQRGELKDPSFFGLVFEGDQKRWQNRGKPGTAQSREAILSGKAKSPWKRKPTGWYAANPSLEGNPGGFLRLADLESDCRDAQQSPAQLNDFLRLRLDLWTESVVRWIPQEKWDDCKGKVHDADDYGGRRCFIGGDLSSTRDVTAIVYLIEDGAGWTLLPKLYLPEVGVELRSRADGVPYAHWAAQGYLTLTPGPTINYDYILRDVLELSKIFSVDSVTFDRWNAQGLAQDLDDEGFTVRLISQGFGDMSPAAKEFERMVYAGELLHGGNPLLDWMVSCTEVATNTTGEIRPKKPDRQTSTKRIDGVVAAINAVTGLMRDEGDGGIGITVLSA